MVNGCVATERRVWGSSLSVGAKPLYFIDFSILLLSKNLCQRRYARIARICGAGVGGTRGAGARVARFAA